MHMFRSPTTCRNIRYQVQEDEGDVIEVIYQLVKTKLEEYIAPSKIVIYSGSIEQTIEIGEALECPVYYYNIDDRARKARRMKELIEGSSRVIAATNALGLGVDLPDIRVVIHAGEPPNLRDYLQESGRAGRDGKSSEAIIVCRHIEQPKQWSKSWAQSRGEDIVDFMAGYNCRRVIMDRIMDGRMDRVGCEEGEEPCDVCQRNQGMDLPLPLLASSPHVVRASQEGLPTIRGNEEGLISSDVGFRDSGIGKSMSSQVQESIVPSSPPNVPSSPVSEDQGFMNHSPIPGRFQTSQDDMEMQTMLEQQQRERQWLASSITRQCREEGQEIAEFEEALRKWANRCPLCKLQGMRQQQHRLEDCTHPELAEVLEGVRFMTEEIQGKKRFAEFSCCYDCGVPQAICQKWKQKDEQGWFEKVRGVECQYKGVLIPVVAVIWRAWDSKETDIIWKWIEEDLVERDNSEEVYKWFGRKVMWGRIEATKLCKVFHVLTRMVEEEKGL